MSSDFEDFIRTPVIKNKFSVNFSSLNKELNDLMCKQVIKCELDIASNSLKIKLEQPLESCKVMKVIEILSRLPIVKIDIRHFDVNFNQKSSFTYSGKLSRHSYKLNYTKSDVATHTLIFEGF